MKNLKIVVALSVVAALGVGPVSAQTEDRATDLAMAHMTAQVIAQGGEAADVAEAVVTDRVTSAHNGVTHVYLEQTLHGLPVLGAVATVNLKDDAVVFSGASFLTDLADVAAGTQTLDAPEATSVAASAVDLSTSALSTQPRQVYQAIGEEARLAWNVDLQTTTHAYNVSVDAQTGEVLVVHDRVDEDTVGDIALSTARADEAATAATLVEPVLPPEQADDGSDYLVYPMPMENPADGDRVVVTNPADAASSPFGWHDLDGVEGADTTNTVGNNVHAYVDTISTSLPVRYIGPGNEVPNSVLDLIVDTEGGDPLSEGEGGEELSFNDPIDFSTTPSSYRPAAVTNLFYWNNVIHDVTASYGFDEAAGNFQTTNYTGTGVGGDSVRAEAQDGSGVNNANFFTPADGQRPRMQMYIWPDADETRDGDLDAGIIAHEYGHGISNRLIGGASRVDCIGGYGEAEGEGISDFFAYALTMRDSDDGATPRGVGTYVLHQQNRSGLGIRPTPYSTDMTINPSTYNTIGKSGISAPHGVGYVWASMMWDVYWALVADHGFNANVYEGWRTGGNNLTIQLLMDGMKMAPCGPSFTQLRDAMLAADVALTDGDNMCTMWSAFARRGLGVDAQSGDKNVRTDQVESFNVPAGCS